MTHRKLAPLASSVLALAFLFLASPGTSAQSPTVTPAPTAPATEAPAPTEQPVPTVGVQTEAPDVQPVPGTTEDDDDDGLPTGLIVALIILGVVAVLAIFLMFFRPDRRPRDPREPL